MIARKALAVDYVNSNYPVNTAYIGWLESKISPFDDYIAWSEYVGSYNYNYYNYYIAVGDLSVNGNIVSGNDVTVYSVYRTSDGYQYSSSVDSFTLHVSYPAMTYTNLNLGVAGNLERGVLIDLFEVSFSLFCVVIIFCVTCYIFSLFCSCFGRR